MPCILQNMFFNPVKSLKNFLILNYKRVNDLKSAIFHNNRLLGVEVIFKYSLVPSLLDYNNANMTKIYS